MPTIPTPLRRVSVIGLGKLGSCVAAALASKGCEVIGVDVDPRTVALMNEGQTALTEPGLSALLASHRARLRATHDCQEAITTSDVSFIVVPTPSEPDGQFSLHYVMQVAEEVGRGLAKKTAPHLVVLSSTVLPGSMTGKVQPLLEEESGKHCGRDFGLCYSPLFVSLGSVLRNILNPDFVLIGESHPEAGSTLERLYQRVCDNHPTAARMNFVNAELTKLAVNTYVTTKITFANMLTQLCERLPEADIDVVTAALGLDARIGHRYLTGGLSYGGPCFPRDNLALIALARQLGNSALIAESTDRLNRLHAELVLQRISSCLVRNRCVAILGLAYKPDTDVLDESAGLFLARELARQGHDVMVFDPLAVEHARATLGNVVRYAADLPTCLSWAEAVVIASPCHEFRAMSASSFPCREQPVLLFDCWRILRGKLEGAPHIRYIPFGLGSHNSFEPTMASGIAVEAL